MFFARPFIIISFSSRHRLKFRFPFLPAGISLTMAHLIENCRVFFFFLRFETCLDNSVSCLYFKWFLLSVKTADLCLVSLLCVRSTYNGIERSSSSYHTINLVLLLIYRYMYVGIYIELKYILVVFHFSQNIKHKC